MTPTWEAISRYNAEAAATTSALREAGCDFRNLRDVEMTPENCDAVYPILLAGLARVRYWPVADDVSYALAKPLVETAIMPILIDLFRNTPPDYYLEPDGVPSVEAVIRIRQAFGDRISQLAGPRWADEILDLVLDRSLGDARFALILRLNRLKSDLFAATLIELLDDPTISGHAVKALRAARVHSALPHIERLVDSPDEYTRQEARETVRRWGT